MKNDKRTSHDLQNTKKKLRSSNMNPTKNRGELRCSGRVGSSCSTCDMITSTSIMLLLNNMNIIWYWFCVGHQYTWMNTNNKDKTWTSYKTNGSKDETNIVNVLYYFNSCSVCFAKTSSLYRCKNSNFKLFQIKKWNYFQY